MRSAGLPGPLVCVVGARPNFMKIAPIMHAFARMVPGLPVRLVHTGQHYDARMNGEFFRSLGIPDPDVNLDVGSGTHAVQTAEIMRRFEPVIDREAPCAVLVVGDVNSTIACALVAAKRNVPIVHVEAGLRSLDRTMPEEVNRVVTDQLSDLLFTTEPGARANLLREGIDEARIRFVGNVMIDTLREHAAHAVPPALTLAKHGADADRIGERYAVLTLHRPSNVDDETTLHALLATLREVGERLPVVFPMHPRTAARLAHGSAAAFVDGRTIVALPPVGYLEMLGLMKSATLVLTDSGGMQEETTALGVPCLTLRENTERPVTVEQGTNTLVGRNPARILAAADEILAGGGKAGRLPALWDGHAAERIANVLADWLPRCMDRRQAA